MAKDVRKQSLRLPRSSFSETVIFNKKGWISPAFQRVTCKGLYLTDA